MLIGLCVYTGYTAKRRTKKAKGSAWYKWGPTILVSIASCLIISDTVRHVLQVRAAHLHLPPWLPLPPPPPRPAPFTGARPWVLLLFALVFG
jgi:hypothetical protein